MKMLKFFAVIFVTVSLMAEKYESLTIDNQLVIIANDCYTRIAIGSILPTKEITTSVIAATVTECEDECSKKRNTCEVFSFGISSKGNATCLLGTRIPNPDELVSNSDYDIYIRQQSSPHCMPDRLYKLGSGQRNPTNFNNDKKEGIDHEDKKNSKNETSRVPKPGNRPKDQNSIPKPGGTGIVPFPNAEKIPANVNYHNYQNYPGYQNAQVFPNFSPTGYPVQNPGSIYDEDNPNGPFNYGDKNPYENTQNGYNGNAESHRVQGNQNFNNGDFYPGVIHGIGNGDRDDDYYLHSVIESGNRYGINIYESPDTVSCYRKLFAGKRLAEIHIRRAVDCEQIEDCSRECDTEKGFPCEGFNYRNSGSRGTQTRGRGHGICELTSMPPSQIDIGRDIQHEPRYDYYERDIGCQNKRPAPFRPSSNSQSGWHNLRPSSSSRPQEDGPYLPRPLPPDRRPSSSSRPQEDGPYLPRPLPPDRRPSIEVPRPFGHDYLPNRRYHGDSEPPRPWRPENSYPQRIPNLNIRPIEDDIRYDYFRPSGRPISPPKDRRPDYWHRPQAPDLGMNEIEPYQPGRRKDSVYGSGSGSGGIYGGSYGYNTNYIDNPNYDNPNRGNTPRYNKRPFGGNEAAVYGGDVYNYGGAFGYGDSNHIQNNRDNLYGGSRPRDDCSTRSGAGFKLRRGIVRKSYLTPSLDQCEYLCAIERDCLCMTFSYRYSLAANAPTDNCLLSEISYRDLDFYTDLEPDRDYDIYSMTGDQKLCEKERPVSERLPEECFWRVRSGCGVPPEVIRKTIVAQGIGDCEAECVEARLFTCRSFVYRYNEGRSSSHGSPNCFLSDWPSQEIDPLSLPELDGAELYQRGSFGRGCEPSPFPPLNSHWNRPAEPANNRPMKKDEVCYAEYKKPCRLTPNAVIFTIYVNSEFECRERCTEMRKRDRSVPCMSFSYRISSERDQDHNCFMSDVPRRDLRPGIDYVHGDGHLLFAWKEFEPQCDSGYAIGIFIDDNRDYPPKRPSTGLSQGHFEPPFENEPRPPRPHGNRYPPPLDFEDQRPIGHNGYAGNSRPINDGPGYNDPGLHRPLNPDRPDPIGPNYGGGGGGGGGGSFYDTDVRFGHGYSDDRYNDFSHKHGGSTFQYFTVNGRPCKQGTKCERNKVAGFWSCEPEGSEFGTWDYCCEPKHHCGYSQGYHYPWCYVGPYEDQWRPCSEKYYPYFPSHKPIRPSSDRYHTDDDEYGEVPRPGMLGRHWPVAYLHRESPPNATDSFRMADRRRNRELQNVSVEINSSSISRGENIRDNYLTRSSNLEPESQSSSVNAGRAAKIERITRFSESQNRKSTISRNWTNTKKNETENRREIDQIIEFKDLIDARDSAALETNKTPLVSTDWSETTFIRLPTISPNKTTNISGTEKFEDYFEVVDVE